ncbi:MAG: Sporulation initiation phosphotransferase F [Deltaproteobacteria bacterium ADurb.Bin151]|nr:MAG: Sporulation initiation phosphotransferase F [Deltaproteobacteria bacterium ADurb.Bin151]HOQ42260.1 response regulator [Smithellaceae bacterium]HPL65722.1 response regulator [Smithellaceae bacterium]HRY35103.1 response regulator [Smithellaceae bacterium]
MKGKILIIDDETSVRELFTGVFTDEDYEVIATEDGNRALEILEQDNIDVIFLDLKLFGMNGIDLCRQIREMKPMSMIFAITGWASLFEIEECRQAGFDDYFEKPLDMDMLTDAVAEAIKKLDRWKKRYYKTQK